MTARKTPYAPAKLNSKSANGGQARKIDASTYTVTGLSRDAARRHTGQCGETHRNPPITGHVVGHILCPARDPPSRAQPNGYRKYTTCEYSYSAHRVRVTQRQIVQKIKVYFENCRVETQGIRARTHRGERHCVVKDRSSLGVIGLECSLGYILESKNSRKVVFSSSG